MERLERIEEQLAAEDDLQSNYDWHDKSHRGRGQNRQSKRCYNCHQEGHFTRDCLIPKEDERNSSVEAVAKTVTSESETQGTDFPQENHAVSVCSGDGSNRSAMFHE